MNRYELFKAAQMLTNDGAIVVNHPLPRSAFGDKFAENFDRIFRKNEPAKIIDPILDPNMAVDEAKFIDPVTGKTLLTITNIGPKK